MTTWRATRIMLDELGPYAAEVAEGEQWNGWAVARVSEPVFFAMVADGLLYGQADDVDVEMYRGQGDVDLMGYCVSEADPACDDCGRQEVSSGCGTADGCEPLEADERCAQCYAGTDTVDATGRCLSCAGDA